MGAVPSEVHEDLDKAAADDKAKALELLQEATDVNADINQANAEMADEDFESSVDIRAALLNELDGILRDEAQTKVLSEVKDNIQERVDSGEIEQ